MTQNNFVRMPYNIILRLIFGVHLLALQDQKKSRLRVHSTFKTTSTQQLNKTFKTSGFKRCLTDILSKVSTKLKAKKKQSTLDVPHYATLAYAKYIYIIIFG